MATKVALTLPRGTRTDVAAADVLVRLADVAEEKLPGAVTGADPELLHDLRVSVRRARSVLRELDGVHPRKPRKHLRAELKWLQALTGPVRDLDVQLGEWDATAALLPESAREQLTPLRIRLQGRLLRERSLMVDALRSPRFVGALEAWRELAALPTGGGDDGRPNAGRPIEATAGERIRSVYRRMVDDGCEIDESAPDEALHDLRKRGKELRYLLEIFGGLFDAEVVKPMVAALKRLQDVLGRFQDRSVQLERLADEPEAALLREALRADQQLARADFAERFAAFAAEERHELVERTF